jgi:hypothetical protein
MFTIPRFDFFALNYASRNKKHKLKASFSATDILGSRLDGDSDEARMSMSAHKFVERLIQHESLSQAEIDHLAIDCPSIEELRRRIAQASRKKVDIDRLFSPLPGQSDSPFKAMLRSRFGVDDPVLSDEAIGRVEAKLRAQHEKDCADPSGSKKRERERACLWLPDLLDDMKRAQDKMPPDERQSPNPIDHAGRAEIRRVAEASVHLCRNAPQFAIEDFEVEFANPQWHGLKVVEAFRNLPTAHGAITVEHLEGLIFGLMVTGLLWQIAVFEACSQHPQQLVCWFLIIPEPSAKGGYRCGPQWVERLVAVFPSSNELPRRGKPPSRLRNEPPQRGKPSSRLRQVASRLVGDDHSSTTSIETRTKELRDLSSGEAELTFARVERLSLEAIQSLSVGLGGQPRDNRIADLRQHLRIVGHIAGMLDFFQLTAEHDAKEKSNPKALEHIHAAWDDFPKLREAALAFRAEALQEVEATPATETAGV